MTLFTSLAELLETLSRESSRLKKRAAIAEALVSVHAASPAAPDAGLFAQYLAGLPFPEHDSRKLSAGGALLSRAILTAAQATDAQLSAAYRRHGDLGSAAFDLLQSCPAPEPHAPLTLAAVAETFAALASARTTSARAALVASLLARATPLEAKYLLKLMLGDMRTGVKQSLVEEAIAAAASTPEVPVSPADVRHAVMLEADLAHAVIRAFAGTLAQARMTLFHPLGFMLASPVETPEEAIARFTKEAPAEPPPHSEEEQASPDSRAATPQPASPEALLRDHPRPSAVNAFLEDKYDGMRAQLHFGDPAQPARVALYSRNREDITESYPELVEAFTHALNEPAVAATPPGPTVLDGEILGWDFTHNAPVVGYPDETGDPAHVPHASQSHGDAWENEPLPSPPTLTPAAHVPHPSQSDGWDTDTTHAAQVPHASQPHRDAWERIPLVLPHHGRALPFAVLGQRIGRKRVANDLRARVPVIFMAFDLLVDRGELILHLPLTERRRRLEALTAQLAPQAVSPLELDPQATAAQPSLFASEAPAPAAHPRLLLSPARLVQSAEDIDQAYAAARARSNEGVMIKAAHSHYQPGRRGLAWVKLKRELATLDVVITGAEFGHGRRAGTLSDYTFAVRRGPAPTGPVPHASRSDAWETDTAPHSLHDPAELLNVGKAYSGVTDQEIAELTTFLQAHTLEDHGHFRTVEPLVVLEVAFNNIMRSTRHASGFALRFPRILRLRPDKPLAEIDTLARVEAIYASQIDKPAEE